MRRACRIATLVVVTPPLQFAHQVMDELECTRGGLGGGNARALVRMLLQDRGRAAERRIEVRERRERCPGEGKEKVAKCEKIGGSWRGACG
jgi:hypothetical protein